MGKNISFFDKRIKKKLPKLSLLKNINWKKIDLAFLSLTKWRSTKNNKKNYLKYKMLKFIDLSADFRIKNIKKYKNNYNLNHKAPGLIK